MNISDILRHKGSAVITITADDRVRDLVAVLAAHSIGALVVTAPDAATVRGIVSERDVVRGLHEHGAAVLDRPVAALMSADVITCGPGDLVDDIAATMTSRRVRHMPVLDAGRLIGIVSIGDVVLSRIGQLESDRGQLEHYITG